MPNNYPRDRIFNPHFTTIKDFLEGYYPTGFWYNGLGFRVPIGPKVSVKVQRNFILADWKSIYVERILFYIYC